MQHWQWRHSTANVNLYKSYRNHLTPAYAVFEIFTFKMFHLENLGQDHGVQYCHSKANIYENEGQGKSVAKRDLCHSTANVRLYVGYFFSRDFVYQATYIYAKRIHTLTHKHTIHIHRKTGVMTIGKICKVHLLKNNFKTCKTIGANIFCTD